ncbi:MAG: RES family NAD+ phosphorylase [Acidobacteriota bacterium]|nr:RES family NAD+ phosphorylase [Acidobacteriota bacterium]
MPAAAAFHFQDTHRLVSTRFPTAGILDGVAGPEDLRWVFELHAWTNDRISAELGYLHVLPRSEWVFGRPYSSVIMASFCHPRADGGRFNGPERGAWYAARSLETAHAETIYHRTAELSEIGFFEARVQLRLYLADFDAVLHDIRPPIPENEAYHNPASYAVSQGLGRSLLDEGSNGVVYRSARHPDGECIAAFWPKLVENVRIAAHFEYRWDGTPTPSIHRLQGSPVR